MYPKKLKKKQKTRLKFHYYLFCIIQASRFKTNKQTKRFLKVCEKKTIIVLLFGSFKLFKCQIHKGILETFY